jgi:nucleoid DNA-binding protein
MNRAELIAVVAEKTGFTQKDVEKTVKVMISEVIDTVARKEKQLIC